MQSAKPLNVIPEPKQTPLGLVFINQFRSFLVALLLLASAVSFLFGDVLDGSLILVIVLLNGCIGFFQEFKAKKDVAALRKMVVVVARVIKDGKETQMEAKFLQNDDVVVVESGDKIPADGEILEVANLTVDEALLTGESVPVVKEKGDKVFMATAVLSGRAKFRVSAIGADTRFGMIAKNLEAVSEEKTPLEIKMADLGKKIGLAAIGLICLISLVGIMQGEDMYETFFSGVALAVAAVPEGLPAVLTVALAVGVRRLAKRKAIVKRLSATEALGSVDVILTDKTGTLTKNEMSVKRVEVFGKMEEMLRVFVLCNSSALSFDKVLGDTTEGALLKFARDKGVDYETLRAENPITFEVPFDAKTRIMTVVTLKETLVKGAPERIIREAKNLGEKEKKEWLLTANRMAASGLRVLGCLRNGNFLGIVGIYDAPREEVSEAIRLCERAGIRVVMATGDYPETARAIASEIGLFKTGEEVVTGEQLAEYSDEVLCQNLLKVRVFARVSPADKLRIVEAFQALSKVVAVTGDGVNDAPALKRAQVGVAMGITGTDVAKEAADVIITDDNFSTIVAAVEEGRVIFANLLKAIKFLLASNLGEVLVVVMAIFLGLPAPLSPLALLWINVVSDGLPAISLAVDAKEKEALFRRPKQLGKKDAVQLGVVGSLVAVGTLAVFLMFLPQGEEVARLAAFTAVVLLDLLVVFVVRGRKQKFLANKLLIASVLITLGVQIVILAVPGLREVFV